MENSTAALNTTQPQPVNRAIQKTKKQAIICVDDEQIVLNSLKIELQEAFGEAFDIELAENGEEAIDILKELITEDIEVVAIISDYIMHGMKGDELLTKTHTVSPDTKNILLTGQANLFGITNAINNASLYRYIAKPWDQIDFTLTVKEAIKSYNNKKELKLKNYELNEMNKELKALLQNQSLLIDQKDDQINNQCKRIESYINTMADSISYAKRIQKAVLPSKVRLDKILNQHFVLWKPRDIVSGDFFWVSQEGNSTVVITADSKGYGIPGAFISILSISILNEIVNRMNAKRPHLVLNELDSYIKKSLDQNNGQNQQETLDLTIYAIDRIYNTMYFSGAQSSIILVRRKDNHLPELFGEVVLENSTHLLIEQEGSPFSVGAAKETSKFRTWQVPLFEGDTLYSYTNGFCKQFGTEKCLDLKKRHLYKILLELQHTPIQKQKDALDKAMSSALKKHVQIDDILVVGLKV